MRVNTSPVRQDHGLAHEGAPAARVTPEQALRRSVLSCMLWEKEFYEDGRAIADRIRALSADVSRETLAALAVEARHEAHLRHAPLLLLRELVRRGGGRIVADTIARTVARADELAEFVALYWATNDGRRTMSAQMKKGLAAALGKFDEYALAKYDRASAVRLRDVLFLSHARAADPEREALYRRLAASELTTPDTWEVELSAGGDKRAVFERLIRERRLGYMALLRNLRGMVEAGCDLGLVREAIVARRGAERVLPFRYVAAARACPQLEPEIDQALCESVAAAPALRGRTAVMVDVSGSMEAKLSGRSDMTRMDAAAALASVVSAESLRVFTFSNTLCEEPPRRGMAGVDSIIWSQPHAGTYLGQCVREVCARVPHDRLIVITDEQSADRVPDPVARHAYMINVASARHGVGYGRWTHLDGFSESVIRWIGQTEDRA